MSLATFYFYSDVLNSSQKISIPLPEPKTMLTEEKSEMEVLYLLHGAQGSEHSWVSSSNVERFLYESERNMAVIIPTMKTNFYTDHKIGDKYYTYIAKELPKIVETYLNVSFKRENTYVAGLSMGGVETKLITLRRPEVFGYWGLLSGGVYQPDDIKDPKAVKYIFESCGSKENPEGINKSVEALKAAGFNAEGFISEGTAHEFLTWRRSLYLMAQKLFK